MNMEKEQRLSRNFNSFKFNKKHIMIIAVLVIAFTTGSMLRSLPLQYGSFLNEFDPYFDLRATQFLVDNGVEKYFTWHDTMSWYPEGRDIAATSQTGLHLTAALLYNIFGSGTTLHDFVIWFPVVFSSLTAIVIFALVREISTTTAGLCAALFFAVSPAIILRGKLGWFKSEPLGLFLSLLAMYLLLSALKHKEIRLAILKAIGGGLFLALGMASWGGVQYFSLLLGLFFIVGILLYSAGSEIVELFTLENANDVQLKPFSIIIFLTLALAVFDLGKTTIEEEVLMQKDILRHSSTRRTITRFIATILIAVSIEALLLMFKSVLGSAEHLTSAVAMMATSIGLLIGLGIYVYLGAKAENLLKAQLQRHANTTQATINTL